jgi:hypothetical protein
MNFAEEDPIQDSQIINLDDNKSSNKNYKNISKKQNELFCGAT